LLRPIPSRCTPPRPRTTARTARSPPRPPSTTAIRDSSFLGGVGVFVGQLDDLVAQLLVRRDLAQQLPDLRVCERLDGTASGFGLARHRSRPLGPELLHAVHIGLRREELRLLPCENGRLIE